MKIIKLRKSQIYNGNLILINALNPIRKLSKEGLVLFDTGYSSVLMKHNAANKLQYVFERIRCTNKIVAVSGYRTLKEQEEIYHSSLRVNGQSFTEKYIALPNHSEHHTGLAIDLGLKKEIIDFVRPEFPYDGICNEFRKLASCYGFIERYQREKESITGIAHEPWHFRYVGYPHSEIMEKENLSLEEYIQYIKNFTYAGEHLYISGNDKEIEIFYIPFDTFESAEVLIPEYSVYQVSGNNMDGCIITLWRCKNG